MFTAPNMMREQAPVLMETNAHFYIVQQVTLSADTTSATIKQDHVFTKLIRKATAAKMATTVPLHMDHMTCAAPSMISEKCR